MMQGPRLACIVSRGPEACRTGQKSFHLCHLSAIGVQKALEIVETTNFLNGKQT